MNDIYHKIDTWKTVYSSTVAIRFEILLLFSLHSRCFSVQIFSWFFFVFLIFFLFRFSIVILKEAQWLRICNALLSKHQFQFNRMLANISHSPFQIIVDGVEEHIQQINRKTIRENVCLMAMPMHGESKSSDIECN